jgi:hypothetical protein
MEAISRFLEPLTRPVSLNTIEKGVRGVGNEAKRDAIARLVIEGYVSQVPVGVSLHNASIRPYRADPFGSDLPIIDLAGPRRTSPGEVAEATHLAPPETPLRRRGFRGEVDRGSIDDLEDETSPEAGQNPGEVERRLDFNDSGDLVDLDTGEIIDQNDID